MLEFLDLLFTCLHIFLIGFNLFGWIWPASRRAHLISLIITLAFWSLAGFWYGWGYCPLTDWHWQIKDKLGENDLPASFIKYMADKITGAHFSPELVDGLTLGIFLLVIVWSVYVNFFRIRNLNK
jgi:hypothetical protein